MQYFNLRLENDFQQASLKALKSLLLIHLSSLFIDICNLECRYKYSSPNGSLFSKFCLQWSKQLIWEPRANACFCFYFVVFIFSLFPCHCGLESTLRKMNVEQDGENSPEELPASSFLANFGPNRKRQSSLSFSPTKNNNINNNSQSAASPNRATASRSSKSSSNAFLQKQQNTSSQHPQNSQNSQNPQNPQNSQNHQNHQNQANTPQFQNQQLFNKNYNAQGEQFSTPKSSNQLNEHQSSSSNFESTSIEPVEVSSPLKKSFEKKFNYSAFENFGPAPKFGHF